MAPDLRNSPYQQTARVLLGAALSFAGYAHLTFARTEFLAQVPDWIPVDGDLTVVISGVVEIAMGLALIFWTRQRLALGWIASLFFVFVFPGNIAQWLDHRDAFGLNTDQARFIRLLFQPVLIVWALWSTGAWKSWKNRR